VFKVLPEVLEKQFGYKLFIYGRDDNVGEGVYIMQESKRPIVLVKFGFYLSRRLWHGCTYLTILRVFSVVYNDNFHVYCMPSIYFSHSLPDQ
jgi:hypothetical protein